MHSSIKTHQDIMPSGIFLDETAVSSVQRNTMRSNVLSNNTLKMLLLFVISFFSHMAHSADPIVCEPTGGVRRIYINANITITPAGAVGGMGYTAATPVAQPGPITCPAYTPTAYTLIAMGPDGSISPSGSAYVDISQGFSALLSLNTAPGISQQSATTSISGSTPNIPSNIYPSVYFYANPNVINTHDVDLHNYFIGYIMTTGYSRDSIHIPSDKSGLTEVYVSGHIHIPPYCSYTPSESMIMMPTVFAADFANAGAGGKVGGTKSITGSGLCAGGSQSGEDTVHISISSPGAEIDNYTLGVFGQPDIGIQVFKPDGTPLQVNGPVADTVPTNPTWQGENLYGHFDYPLTFQMISVTGKAPPSNVGGHMAYVLITLSMD